MLEQMQQVVEELESKKGHALVVEHDANGFLLRHESAQLFQEIEKIGVAFFRFTRVEVKLNAKISEANARSHCAWKWLGHGDSLELQFLEDSQG